MKKLFLLLLPIIIFFLWITKVMANYSHECAFTTSWELECWWENNNWQANVPNGYVFNKINVWWLHTCWITDDKELKCWWDNSYWQLNIPSWFKWENISWDLFHSCWITDENDLKCWWSNKDWQLDIPNWFKWIDIWSAWVASCWITDANELKCWWRNSYWQLDIPTWYKWKNIEAGYFNVCWITIEDELKCWWSNYYWQLDIENSWIWKKIDVWFYHTCKINNDSDLECHGDRLNALEWYKWKDISIWWLHICGLVDSNEIICWWDSRYWQTNVPAWYKWKSFTENIEVEDPINLPTPQKLQQYIHTPLLDEEVLEVWTKIWKFQSWSWIILEAEIENSTDEKYNMVFDVYKHWMDTSIYSKSIQVTTWTWRVVLPFLWEWDYVWTVKVTDNFWNQSDILNYWTDLPYEIDFSFFKWFEPYPYGYSFHNWSPSAWLLNWWYEYLYLWDDVNSNYIAKIHDWNLWDLFYKTFDTSKLEWDNRKLVSAFKSSWLENWKVFQWWNCYWLAYSSILSAWNKDLLEKEYPEFYNKIVNSNIFNWIDAPSSLWNSSWDIYDYRLETILSLYLSQLSSNTQRVILDSEISPEDLLSELSKIENKNNLYLLNLYWENINWEVVAHTVFPYRVDWNKVYIVDNNIAYPDRDIRTENFNAYNQYIEIDDVNSKWSSELYTLDWWVKFTDLSLMNLDDLYNWWFKSEPFGYWVNDFLYTLSWTWEILLTDEAWRVTWYKDNITYKEIPWVEIINLLSANIWNNNTNDFKQIYIPEYIDNVLIEVSWTNKWEYDLMISSWDFFTEFKDISTWSWEVDKYQISREKIEFDFDDNKEWTYNLISHDFDNNGTGTIYLWNTTIEEWLTKLDINWEEVINNWESSIIKSVDSDLDWEFEKTEWIKPITKNDWKKWEISWVVFKDKNTNWELDDSDKLLKWYKVALYEEGWDGFLYNKKWKKKKNTKHKYKCYSWLKNPDKHSNKKESYEHEDINCFVKTNKKWEYSFKNLEDWNYMIELLNNKNKKNKDWFWEVYEINILNGSISTDNNFWISKKWKK